MKPIAILVASTFVLCAAAHAQSRDPNATPSMPANTMRQSPQQEASDAMTEARAQCRKEPSQQARKACLDRAQRDYDRERQDKPPARAAATPPPFTSRSDVPATPSPSVTPVTAPVTSPPVKTAPPGPAPVAPAAPAASR